MPVLGALSAHKERANNPHFAFAAYWQRKITTILSWRARRVKMKLL